MKKLIALVLLLTLLLALAGCDQKSIHYIMEHASSVVGVVEEVYEGHVIIYAENAPGYPNGSRWEIQLDVENPDSYLDPKVGDEIVVYYEGAPMEVSPLRVAKVYAITLQTPADRSANEGS